MHDLHSRGDTLYAERPLDVTICDADRADIPPRLGEKPRVAEARGRIMLALYHNDMSSCAQKVRLCLAEKELNWESRHLNLRAGEHHQR